MELSVVTCETEEMSNFFNIGWGFKFDKCLDFIGKWEDGHSTYKVTQVMDLFLEEWAFAQFYYETGLVQVLESIV